MGRGDREREGKGGQGRVSDHDSDKGWTGLGQSRVAKGQGTRRGTATAKGREGTRTTRDGQAGFDGKGEKETTRSEE